MMRLVLGTLLIVISAWVLESARSGVSITHFTVGETPVVFYQTPDSNGPQVIVAHGFAGSSQMMQGYALPLARAGYRVYVFDFLGHGRHPSPMSGDVSSIDGTTRLLVEQTEQVIDAVKASDQKIALLGHSMATDVLVRVAARRPDIGPLVLLSAFSEEIDSDAPRDLLLMVGALEGGLRDFAVDAVQMVDATAQANETIEAHGVVRRAAIAPGIEHVSILQSRVGRNEAMAWLNRSYGLRGTTEITATGPAIAGLLTGLVLILIWAARLLPQRTVPAEDLPYNKLLTITALPAVAAPPLAILLNPGFMPVLVADYLAIHLALYGALQLALLLLWRVPLGGFSVPGAIFLLVGCGVFGLTLDRYAANFMPTGDRYWIIAMMAIGSMVFFIADARLTHSVSLFKRTFIHLAFLVSLLFAVALDFQGLFFLLMIAPVIVLFYLAFGTIGHAVSARVGPLAPGVALGLVLAWSLGVSFPLFQG